MNALAVSAVRHDAHNAILSERATGPATIRVTCPPRVSALVKDMICIDQRNDKVDVEQCPQGSEPLLVHQLPDVIQSDHITPAANNGHSILRQGPLRRCRSGECPSGQG